MESKSLQVFVDFFCKYLSSLNWSRLLPVIRFARIYYSTRGVNKSIKVLSQTTWEIEGKPKYITTFRMINLFSSINIVSKQLSVFE